MCRGAVHTSVQTGYPPTHPPRRCTKRIRAYHALIGGFTTPLCRRRRWDADVAPNPSPVRDQGFGELHSRTATVAARRALDSHGDGATDQDDPDSPRERNEQFSNKAGVDHLRTPGEIQTIRSVIGPDRLPSGGGNPLQAITTYTPNYQAPPGSQCHIGAYDVFYLVGM